MKKDTIVQFVGFVTNLKLNDFIPKWEGYAQKLKGKNTESFLQQHSGETKNKFKYISQHEWNDADFDFTFMNERKSDNFPDHTVRVIQAGGYIPLQIQRKRHKENGDIKIVAFVGHDEREMNFYTELSPLYSNLNIYQAYYESCLYSHVLEFFVKESKFEELMHQLKQRPGVETGVYKDCLVAAV